MDPIQSGISATIAELNKLLRKARDPSAESRLRNLRDVYFALLEAVVKRQLDEQTPDFAHALESMRDATKSIDEAIENISKVSSAIDKATSAAKAIDRIVKLGVQFV